MNVIIFGGKNMNAKDYWTIDELDAIECFDVNKVVSK